MIETVQIPGNVFAVVIHATATNRWLTKIETHHQYASAAVLAASKDEAYGKGTRLAEALFRGEDGWDRPTVTVVGLDRIVDITDESLSGATPIKPRFGEGSE